MYTEIQWGQLVAIICCLSEGLEAFWRIIKQNEGQLVGRYVQLAMWECIETS